MDAKDTLLLEKVILACYREYIKASNYSELHIWLQALDDWAVEMSPAIPVAKGALLSVIGNFVEAKACLKKDLECTGLGELIICRDNRYSIYQDKMEYDISVFEQTYGEFQSQHTEELAAKLLSLYKGEYLSGFEALWAVPQRIRYRKIHDEAEAYLKRLSSRKS